MSHLWGYALVSAGVLGLFLAGRKNLWGWAIGLAIQPVWALYAYHADQPAFYFSAVAYGSVYAHNFYLWVKADAQAKADAVVEMLEREWARPETREDRETVAEEARRAKESLFEADHREDMKDPEYAAQYQQTQDALRAAAHDPNDPFDIWGVSPSYRCFMTRHAHCEPEGADQGCTCLCGHQEPVCACGLEDAIANGAASAFMHWHQLGCPLWAPPQWAEGESQFERKLPDEQRREIFDMLRDNRDRRMCQHDADRHGPETGCIECRCDSHIGHETDLPCGWFTGPYGVPRHGVEQGPAGSTDFQACKDIR